MDTTQITDEFFDQYAAALLDRDERAVASLYAVPALVLFPGQAIAVGDRTQTEQFFASSGALYDGVATAEPDITILAASDDAIWADVRWSHGGTEQEHFCYQLARTGDGWQVAVLTSLPL